MKDLVEGMIIIKARMDIYHLAFGQKLVQEMIIIKARMEFCHLAILSIGQKLELGMIITKARMEFYHLAILAIGLKLERAMLYPLMIGLKIGIIQHLVIHKKIRLHFWKIHSGNNKKLTPPNQVTKFYCNEIEEDQEKIQKMFVSNFFAVLKYTKCVHIRM